MNRLATFACTTSIGPGATNMITGAALATVNRLPVLLLPGDVFASRGPDPALQQLELPWAGDTSVNDAFRPVSKYFDRIWRPEQVVPAALQAMRVSPTMADGRGHPGVPAGRPGRAFEVPDGFREARLAGRPAAPDAAARPRG
jgi:3D-(3,5/4)-trihydroxycyclohexane-1,2-dione acylhydrolase (decyclizing)